MVNRKFQVNLSPFVKKLEMKYLEGDKLTNVPFYYNSVSCQWEIDNLVLIQNCLYYFCLNDSNYFLDPLNQNIYIDKNTMIYSVYNQHLINTEVFEDLISSVKSFKIQNSNLDTYLFTKNFFLTDEVVGLLVTINRTITDTIKNSIIVTFEWIGPDGTYYITDKFLPVDFFQGSSTIKHGLRIDSSTMQTGKWIVRILVNNILNLQSIFYIHSVTYKNPYIQKG
ncbi:hypothetical protein ACIQXI_07590 [Lysinibacillus sp. NPDC097195]|uniref:hypothetical protein n=1 Tax=Lysinibacillus sp. NPDC097195 TaxID=3364141 RepID=UPI0038133CCA